LTRIFCGWKKPPSATTASWGRKWTCSTCNPKRMAASSGTPRASPSGAQLEAYMRRAWMTAGYVEVKTPQVMDARQWEQSGHWGKYRENMFVIPDEVPNTEDEGPVISGEADWMALKPMNCPAHVLIFRQGIKLSRPAAAHGRNGCCHRNEPHGALHGIMRVRQFTQDDAHIFCREDQIVEEVQRFLRPARQRLQGPSALTTMRSSWRCALKSVSAATPMWDKAEE
jgi:threonyl-tRNA synthetase